MIVRGTTLLLRKGQKPSPILLLFLQLGLIQKSVLACFGADNFVRDGGLVRARVRDLETL